jgi:hypothetical protein
MYRAAVKLCSYLYKQITINCGGEFIDSPRFLKNQIFVKVSFHEFLLQLWITINLLLVRTWRRKSMLSFGMSFVAGDDGYGKWDSQPAARARMKGQGDRRRSIFQIPWWLSLIYFLFSSNSLMTFPDFFLIQFKFPDDFPWFFSFSVQIPWFP